MGFLLPIKCCCLHRGFTCITEFLFPSWVDLISILLSVTKTAPNRVLCRADKLWKAGTYGDVSLSDGVVEYAKTHEEIKGAFLTFQKDADQIYPGWKEKLGYTGESSVQAATF